MSRALALSGGAARGSVQVPVIRRLVGQYEYDDYRTHLRRA